MKVLFDTNIVLDVLFNREPYSDNAIALFDAVETKQISQILKMPFCFMLVWMLGLTAL